MSRRGKGWHVIRRTNAYRLLYILILAFGGIGVVYVLVPAAVIGYGWAPAEAIGPALFYVIAIAVAGAYLGFLILCPPLRPEAHGG